MVVYNLKKSILILPSFPEYILENNYTTIYYLEDLSVVIDNKYYNSVKGFKFLY